MKINRKAMKAARAARLEEDRNVRASAIRFLGAYLLRKQLWWYVLEENNRGLLSPVDRFASMFAAQKFITDDSDGGRGA